MKNLVYLLENSKRNPKISIKFINNIIKILEAKKELTWKQSLIYWFAIVIMASPFLCMIYTRKGISQTIEIFTDFTWQWRGIYGGHASTADIIVQNLMIPTIFSFIPLCFCMIVMHGASKLENIIAKIIYFIPSILITFTFVILYFPNRVISIINTMGSTPRREDALIWTLSIWVMVVIISLLLLYPKTKQKILWFLYILIILIAIGGSVLS